MAERERIKNMTTTLAATRKGWIRRVKLWHLLVASLGIHALLLAGFAWYRYRIDTTTGHDVHKSRPSTVSARTEPSPPRKKEPPKPQSPSIRDETIRTAIESEQANADARSPEENLAVLRAGADRLRRISSPESIEEMARRLGQVYPPADRAYEPKTPSPPGAFDSSTALIHHVDKIRTDSGKTAYRYVLVDAAGRSQTVDLPPSPEHERAWRVFQLNRSNPLLRQVYRQMAMPLIDRMTQPPQSGK